MRAIRLQASSSLNGLAVEQIDLPVPAGAGDALVHVPALQLLVVAFWRKYDINARVAISHHLWRGLFSDIGAGGYG
jgi:hypothetical protein